MDYDTKRYVLQRFSVPEPKYDGSPAKVRSSDLRWLHYPDSPLARLVLEVKTRNLDSSRQASSSATHRNNVASAGNNNHVGYGNRYPGNDNCMISVYSGTTCYQRVSVDMFRQAYEAALQCEGSKAGGRDTAGLETTAEVLETMKVTVKDPSVAFRLLEPLSQAYDARDRNKPLTDYTYDRFQVKFKTQVDMEAFLRTLYSYFPAIDPSARYMETRSGSVDSVAPSQHTQIYIPGFQLVRRNRSPDTSPREEPMRHGEKRKAYHDDLPPAKRWTNTPRNDSFTSEWELREEYGKAEMDSQDKQSSLQQTQRESHCLNPSGMAHGGRYAGNRPVPREDFYQPPGSVDADGFVKPFTPALIDTPTPANRLYHLKPVNPNIRKIRESANQLPLLSPTKRSMHAVHVTDPLVSRNLSPDLPIDPQSERHNSRSLHSHQQHVRLPSIGLGGSSAEQEEVVEESMTVPSGMTQIVLGWKAEQEAREAAKNQNQHLSPAKALPHSLRHILAPDTVPTRKPANDPHDFIMNASSQTTGDAPWPSIYGAQEAISSSGNDSATGVLDTHKTAQQNPKISKEDAEKVISVQGSGAGAKKADDDGHASPFEPLPCGNLSYAQAPPKQTLHGSTVQEEATSEPVNQQLTANITSVSTLYTLSGDDLDSVINDILEEDGFIGFVENLQSCWRARVSLLAGSKVHDSIQGRGDE